MTQDSDVGAGLNALTSPDARSRRHAIKLTEAERLFVARADREDFGNPRSQISPPYRCGG